MKLLIKQRVFSWSDTYDIYDEEGEAKYFVKAEFLSIGHRLHVYDRNERELGVIRERVLSFLPVFEIEVEGEIKGQIKQQFTLLRPRYDVDYNGWHVEGDFLGWNYEVFDGRERVVGITKELLHWGDTYVLSFDNPENELEGLFLVLAIDAANCDG